VKPRTLESPVGAEIVIDGNRYINFGGSAYLGLSGNRQIHEAGFAALRQCGSGSPVPRDQGVATGAHQEAEAAAAAFFGTPAALYIAHGYYFGLVTIRALRESYSAIFFDELAHYSLREAIAACGLRSYSYRHLDAADLAAALRRELGANDTPLVVTDGMFPTFGEIAPLGELARAVEPYAGRLLVDESHSFGVLGPLGRGAGEHHGVRAPSILTGGSLGKAFGTCGGIVPASAEEVAAFRLTPTARGASIGLPAAAAMCASSLRYVREHPELLQRLRANVVRVKSGLRRLGLQVNDSIAPVAAFVTGPGKSMAALRQELMAEGIFVYHTNYVGAGPGGVIRCGIFADHTDEHIERLLEALQRLL
jgi:8-amino-7-oxononanoate synthase